MAVINKKGTDKLDGVNFKAGERFAQSIWQPTGTGEGSPVPPGLACVQRAAGVTLS